DISAALLGEMRPLVALRIGSCTVILQVQAEGVERISSKLSVAVALCHPPALPCPSSGMVVVNLKREAENFPTVIERGIGPGIPARLGTLVSRVAMERSRHARTWADVRMIHRYTARPPRLGASVRSGRGATMPRLRQA